MIECVAQAWPVDVTALKQGDTIDVRHLTRDSVEHRNFSLHLVKYKTIIERKLKDAGIILHVRIAGNVLKVMTDAELAEHAKGQAYQAFHRLRSNSAKLADVDRAALTDAQRLSHDHHSARLARIAHAATQASRRKQIPVEPFKSRLPKPE